MEDKKKEESEHYESDNGEDEDSDARVSTGVSNYYHCPICVESVEQENTTTTICNHKFHYTCLIEHIAKNNSNCPICRTTLLTGAVGIDVSRNYFEDLLNSLGPTSYHSETSVYYGNVDGVSSSISANKYNQFNMSSGPTGEIYADYSGCTSSQSNKNIGPNGVSS